MGGVKNGNPIKSSTISIDEYKNILLQKIQQVSQQSKEDILIVENRIEECMEFLSKNGSHVNLGIAYEQIQKSLPENVFNTLLTNSAEKLTKDLIEAYELYSSEKIKIIED